MFKSRVFTLYPDYFPGYLEKGLFGKAMKEKIWSLEIVDIRNYAEDKHKTVDDTPYGGGDGMIMKADVLARSLDKNLPQDEKIIYLSPKGKIFDVALDLRKKSKTFGKIYSCVLSEKNSNAIFDLSDSSLSYRVSATSYPAFYFDFFKDKMKHKAFIWVHGLVFNQQ